jgi:hypothetical protein
MARKLEIAFWNYDRTRLLAEGVVKIEGVLSSAKRRSGIASTFSPSWRSMASQNRSSKSLKVLGSPLRYSLTASSIEITLKIELGSARSTPLCLRSYVWSCTPLFWLPLVALSLISRS